MSRWRPPGPQSSPYITPEGYGRLESELAQLWQRRTDVTRALAAAAAEGDRSENAEYIYRKKELGGIDARIRYLQRRMPLLQIVTTVSARDRVYFGARVTLEDDAGQRISYRIVGADELNDVGVDISVDSPVARALLGKSENDEVQFEAGTGTRHCRIVEICYVVTPNEAAR